MKICCMKVHCIFDSLFYSLFFMLRKSHFFHVLAVLVVFDELWTVLVMLFKPYLIAMLTESTKVKYETSSLHTVCDMLLLEYQVSVSLSCFMKC